MRPILTLTRHDAMPTLRKSRLLTSRLGALMADETERAGGLTTAEAPADGPAGGGIEGVNEGIAMGMLPVVIAAAIMVDCGGSRVRTSAAASCLCTTKTWRHRGHVIFAPLLETFASS